MSDDGLYGAYARNAYINALDQHNENLYSWKVYARELETRIEELEAQKQHNLYHLGGALGTASEEGMRKNALYIYLKTINQALKAHFGDNAKQIMSVLSVDNPRFLNMLEHNLREESDKVMRNKLINGNFVTDTKGILGKIPAVKKGYQDVVRMYRNVNGEKIPSLSALEPADASVGFDIDDKAASALIKRVEDAVNGV